LKLQIPGGCHLAPKILIAAAFNNVNVSVEIVTRDAKKGFSVGGPLATTPVLVAPEGVLFESNAIARYVARVNGDSAHLFGFSPVQAAQVDSWISFAADEIELPLSSWVWSHEGKIEGAGVEKSASADVRKVMNGLDGFLKTRTFLVGERITLADVVVATTLLPGFKSVLDGKLRKPFKNVVRWFKTIVNNPVVASVLGEVLLVDESTPCNASQVSQAPKAEEKKAEGDDDDFDCFGDDDEEDEARQAEIQRIADEAKKAKEEKGKVLVEKSVVVLDVKPWDSETDLKALEEKIRTITMEGLEWKGGELKPIAFGVSKLVIMCHIVDKLVSVDDLQEKIQEFEDDVQSTDVAAFSKL